MLLTIESIEKTLIDSLTEAKLSQEKSLEFFFHINVSNSNKRIFLKSSQEINLNNEELAEDLKLHFSDKDKSIIHFDYTFKETCILNYKKIKYFYLLSDTIIIYLGTIIEPSSLDENNSGDKSLVFEILKFIFITGIEHYLKDNLILKKITLLFDNRKTQDDYEFLKNGLIKKIWLESLFYAGINPSQENLKMEDLFSIQIQDDRIDSSEDILVSETNTEINQNVDKNRVFADPISMKNLPQVSSSALSLSSTIAYLPENVKLNDDYLKIHDSYLIGRIFNDLWLASNSVINHWNSYVSNGKVIENFGSSVSDFLSGMMEEFEKTLPSTLRNSSISLGKIKELSDMVQGRITSLFTSQLLILQTQALDKFKDILVWQAKHSQKDFEFEKGIAILEVNDWFESKASKISIPEMRLDYNGAKKELQQVLGEVSEKFKDSAVSKLISIQKTNKKTSKGKLKQSGVVVGFGVTAAVRPRGFGNLQFVSSYSHGPHVFNFSLVNDLDVAEQEGQTRIKPVRVQPSLNFDVDI